MTMIEQNSTRNETLSNSHSMVSNEKFDCGGCRSKFHQIEELQRHLKAEHLRNKTNERKDPKLCFICNDEVSNILKHKSRVHYSFQTVSGGFVFLCSQCDFRSCSMESRDEHFRMKHPNTKGKEVDLPFNKFYCYLCPDVYNTNLRLLEHCFEEHTEETDWMTMILEHEEKLDERYEQHLEDPRIRPTGTKKCSICDEWIEKNNHADHMLNVHLAPQTLNSFLFLCPVCSDFRSFSFNQRNLHLRQQHPNVHPTNQQVTKKFHCEVCPLSFDTRRLLEAHFTSTHTC
ncbi:hypothetical protein M3Y94_00051700 [Aphelenchoides besseyi]|nr:hypothetical protein M3Y94_00051700 [Aphelenchoides besseyi]KAI6217691.1 hypothetical protein M3Y95_01201100 [Aphelenchoides besseyi]